MTYALLWCNTAPYKDDTEPYIPLSAASLICRSSDTWIVLVSTRPGLAQAAHPLEQAILWAMSLSRHSPTMHNQVEVDRRLLTAPRLGLAHRPTTIEASSNQLRTLTALSPTS